MLDKRRFLIGQYHPGSGLLYRLDARTKVILVLMIMIAALIATTVYFYTVLAIAQLALLLSCGLGWSRILRNLRPLVWFIAFTVLFHLLFSGRNDPQVVFNAGFITVTATGVRMAITYGARILIFVLATFILSLTTSPLSLSEAIVALLKPLRWIKIPIDDLGMILFIALRFIPVLADEMDTIRKAQFIRGVEFSGSLRSRIKRTAALILPVFFSALRRADDLSVAIETRGYRSGRTRSSMHPLSFHGLDFVVLGGVTILLAGYIVGGRLWW